MRSVIDARGEGGYFRNVPTRDIGDFGRAEVHVDAGQEVPPPGLHSDHTYRVGSELS